MKKIFLIILAAFTVPFGAVFAQEQSEQEEKKDAISYVLKDSSMIVVYDYERFYRSGLKDSLLSISSELDVSKFFEEFAGKLEVVNDLKKAVFFGVGDNLEDTKGGVIFEWPGAARNLDRLLDNAKPNEYFSVTETKTIKATGQKVYILTSNSEIPDLSAVGGASLMNMPGSAPAEQAEEKSKPARPLLAVMALDDYHVLVIDNEYLPRYIVGEKGLGEPLSEYFADLKTDAILYGALLADAIALPLPVSDDADPGLSAVSFYFDCTGTGDDLALEVRLTVELLKKSSALEGFKRLQEGFSLITIAMTADPSKQPIAEALEKAIKFSLVQEKQIRIDINLPFTLIGKIKTMMEEAAAAAAAENTLPAADDESGDSDEEYDFDFE